MRFVESPLVTNGEGGIDNAATEKLQRPSTASRRGLILGLATVASAIAAPSLTIGQNTEGIRRLRMINHRAEEMLDVVYWLDGKYIDEALHAINYFMRDVRENKSMPMDKRNINNLAATQVLLESAEPFALISGYRTQKTNRLLARRSSNVARNSLHIKGMAADIRMKSRSVSRIASAAKHCAYGGVGQYPSSDFVHIDCGRTRSW